MIRSRSVKGSSNSSSIAVNSACRGGSPSWSSQQHRLAKFIQFLRQLVVLSLRPLHSPTFVQPVRQGVYCCNCALSTPDWAINASDRPPPPAIALMASAARRSARGIQDGFLGPSAILADAARRFTLQITGKVVSTLPAAPLLADRSRHAQWQRIAVATPKSAQASRRSGQLVLHQRLFKQRRTQERSVNPGIR